jgi:hypothetical protein
MISPRMSATAQASIPPVSNRYQCLQEVNFRMRNTDRKRPGRRLLPAALLCALAVAPLTLSAVTPASAAVGAPHQVPAATAAAQQCQPGHPVPGAAKHCLVLQWATGPSALRPDQRARASRIAAQAAGRRAAGQSPAASDVNDPVSPPLECNFLTGAVDSDPDRLTSCGERTANVTDVSTQTGQPSEPTASRPSSGSP